MKILVKNQRAGFDYEIIDRWEAGLELLGGEVKALKTGRGASLTGAHVSFRDGEAYLAGVHIAPYQINNQTADYDSRRDRKLLLKKGELKRLIGSATTERLTVIPLSIYSKGWRIKAAIALARGKKRRDKRQTVKKRDAEREIRQKFKDSQQ